MNILSQKSDSGDAAKKKGETNLLANVVKQIQMNKMIALLQFFTIIGLAILLVAVTTDRTCSGDRTTCCLCQSTK